MIIEFKHIGTSLGTRKSGAEVREQIESALKSGHRVIFDFNGVEVVSNSFADETFAKLLLKFELRFVKQHTTFQNANSFIQQSIAFALKERLSQFAR